MKKNRKKKTPKKDVYAKRLDWDLARCKAYAKMMEEWSYSKGNDPFPDT